MDRNKEIEAEYEKCIKIASFLNSKSGDESLQIFIQAIKHTYKKKSLSGLKQISRDLKEWINGLPSDEIEELSETLSEIRSPSLQNILKIGIITNDEEYTFLIRKIEEMYNDPSQSDTIERLNKILNNYEMGK